MIETILLSIVLAQTPSQPANSYGWELGAIMGLGLGAAVLVSSTKRQHPTSSVQTPISNPQYPHVSSLGKQAQVPIPSVELPSPPLDEPLSIAEDEFQHYRQQGLRIITGSVAVDPTSDRSKVLVAPPRCGKTTMVYLMLDQQFNRHPKTEAWVWQSKGVEPLHPKIAKSRHFGFDPTILDTSPVDKVWAVYQRRQKQLERGVNVFTPVMLIICDWQALKDTFEGCNAKLFKHCLAKLRGIVLNGPALGMTIFLECHSANISDWGFGSGAIRDAFDIYALSRIVYVEGEPRGDVKALPKLINRDDFVVDSRERDSLAKEFNLLKKGMEEGQIKSSIILSTVGKNRLGITPEFERLNLTFAVEPERSTERSEPLEPNAAEPVEPLPNKAEPFAEPAERSEPFDPEHPQISLNERVSVGELQRSGFPKDKIIEKLWNATKGGGRKYKMSELRYSLIVGDEWVETIRKWMLSKNKDVDAEETKSRYKILRGQELSDNGAAIILNYFEV